jgi:tetratricopeptide (TPR) repeat protein
MRIGILLAVLGSACAREIRSTNPDFWLELASDHFILRTDVPEEDARRAIADLELIRNALLAAGWHGKTTSPARIVVVAVASERELHEFLPEDWDGVARRDRFGERTILVPADGDLLDSETVKHEVSHALLSEYLTTVPRWVTEGIACLLETLEIDRRKGQAVRGGSTWQRRNWLHNRKSIRISLGKATAINWSLEIMGIPPDLNGAEGYAFETLSWALVHGLVDTEPKKFDAFLAGLARGEGMWTAFSAAFPGFAEPQIAAAMQKHFADIQSTVRKAVFPVNAWQGRELLRRMPAVEVHALRAELLAAFNGRTNKQKVEEELARARGADPAHPWVLALSGKNADLKLAIERHPEDWRSWEIWFDANENDIAAIRKAAELAPQNAGVLARLAAAEQEQGQSAKAIQLGERAVAISAGPFELHSLATVYEKNGRCAEAITNEERAAAALPDRVDPRLLSVFRKGLERITASCGKGDVNGSTAHMVEAEPVLKICRQPLYVEPASAKTISVQFTIREDGSVAAVAVRGASDNRQAGMLRQFVESCSFEPVIAAGKARRVELDLTLDAFLH